MHLRQTSRRNCSNPSEDLSVERTTRGERLFAFAGRKTFGRLVAKVKRRFGGTPAYKTCLHFTAGLIPKRECLGSLRISSIVVQTRDGRFLEGRKTDVIGQRYHRGMLAIRSRRAGLGDASIKDAQVGREERIRIGLRYTQPLMNLLARMPIAHRPHPGRAPIGRKSA